MCSILIFIYLSSLFFSRFLFFFFFKQKTAYEMRISDWSSDVCSSDLLLELPFDITTKIYLHEQLRALFSIIRKDLPVLFPHYRILDGNITTRFVPTRDEPMHLDIFKKSLP